MLTLKLTVDKVVKHSVRYSTDKNASGPSLQVYVPKEAALLVKIQSNAQIELHEGFPKHIEVTFKGV